MVSKKKTTKSKILNKNINKNINKINIKIGDTATKKKSKRTYKRTQEIKKSFAPPISSVITVQTPVTQPFNQEYERKLIKLLESNMIKPEKNKVSDKKITDNGLINDLIEEAKRPETKQEYTVDKGVTDINENAMPEWALRSPINQKLPFGSPSDYEVLQQSEKSDNALTDLITRNNKGERNDFANTQNLNETPQDIEDDVETVLYGDIEGFQIADNDNPIYGYTKAGKVRTTPSKIQIIYYKKTGEWVDPELLNTKGELKKIRITKK